MTSPRSWHISLATLSFSLSVADTLLYALAFLAGLSQLWMVLMCSCAGMLFRSFCLAIYFCLSGLTPRALCHVVAGSLCALH